MRPCGEPCAADVSDDLPLLNPATPPNTGGNTAEMQIAGGVVTRMLDLDEIAVATPVTGFQNLPIPYGPNRVPLGAA